MRKLAILTGGSKGQSFDLTQGTVSIGRADENNIVLEDTEVSRRHVLLTYDGAEYKLRDVGSRNGTRVNGKAILETKLVPGDTVQLGTVDLRYEATEVKIVTPPGAAPADTDRVKQLQTQIEQLTTQNRELTTQISTAQQQLAATQQRAGAGGLTKVETDFVRVRAELEEARKAAAQVTVLQQEKQSLAAQLTTAQNQVTEMQRHATEQGLGDIAKLSAELARAKTEAEQFRVAVSQVQTLVLEKTQLQKQLDTVQHQFSDERRQTAEREVALRQKVETELTGLRAELQRSATELAATKHELDEAKKLTARVEELTTQNRTLESQLTGIKGELSKAQTDLNAAWQDVTVARQRVAEEQRRNSDAVKLGDELEKMRQQLAEAKQVATRVTDLQRERDRLATHLIGVEQQMISARDQATRGLQEAEKLRRELTQAQSDINLAKKETSKIVVAPRAAAGTSGAKPVVEVQQLTDELAETKARLKEVSVELTKAKSDLDDVHQTDLPVAATRSPSPTVSLEQPLIPQAFAPPRPAVVEVVKPEATSVRDPAARRNAVEAQIAELEMKIVECEREFPGRETDELKRWRADLAIARANLYSVVMKRSRAARPAAGSRPAEQSRARLAEAPRKKVPTFALAGLAVFAVLVLGTMLWLSMRWSQQSPVTSSPVPVETKRRAPVTPPRVIVEPSTESSEPQNAVPGDSATADWQAQEDPQGRFACLIPPDWKVTEEGDASQSKLKLEKDNNVIYVMSHGSDWPSLTREDQAAAAETFRLRAMTLFPSALYGETGVVTWRTMEGEPALQQEATITNPDKTISPVVSVEYRKQGRAHVIDLYVANAKDFPVVATVFAQFLENFRTISGQTGIAW